MDTNLARSNLINNQLKPWGSLNNRANNALMDIPRELFVPNGFQNLAFADIEIPLDKTTKMFYPKIEGKILDALNIQANESVLEIGTGSGYLTACISMLSKDIYSIDINETFLETAKKHIETLQLDNVSFKHHDASTSIDFERFFDVVLIGVSIPKITTQYLHLLTIGGRIFVVEGVGNIMQAKLITRTSDTDWQTESLFETKLDVMKGLEQSKSFIF